MPIVTTAPGALEQPDAAAYVALSVSTMQRLVRVGKFPKPRMLSEKRAGYLVRELDAWLEARPVSDQLPPENTRRGDVSPRTSPDACPT